MPEFLRDIALSFAPEQVRRLHRPNLVLALRATVLTGLLEMLLGSWWLIAGYRTFLGLRLQQYGQVLSRGNETTQTWFGGIFFVEYVLFHPLALLLLYFSLEGLVRFVGGLCVSEIVPSLPVVLFFAGKARMRRKQEQDQLQALASIPDTVEELSGGDGFRIASALIKPTWNASVTIEIRGEHYELERQEIGSPPRTHIYFLRRAPIGKILRGYERYDLS